jgi:hypothetical protein
MSDAPFGMLSVSVPTRSVPMVAGSASWMTPLVSSVAVVSDASLTRRDHEWR